MTILYDRLKPLLSLVLFAAVAYLLHREFSHYKISDIRTGFAAMPWWRVGAAVALTAANHFVYVGYDLLGLRALGKHLRLGQVCSASILSYVASNNFGALLGGTSVRYRLYSSFGLSSFEIVKISAMLLTTFTVGLSSLAAVVFLARPIAWPASLHFPFATTQPLAYSLIGIALLYFVLNFLHAKVPDQWRRVIPLPGVGLGLAQILLSCAEIMLASSILYVLITASVTIDYLSFLGIFLLAVIAVMFTHVPGGLGIFEFVILKLLPDGHSPEVLGALLIYRVVFYLLPLVSALLLFAGKQAFGHREQIFGATNVATNLFGQVGPRMIAGLAFVAGALLLLSTAVPLAPRHTAWLEDNLPLPVAEGSHLLTSLIGAALLVLARGLQRRLDSAYWLTLILVSAGAIISLTKGLRWELAIVLTLIALVLVLCRHFFYREGRLINQPFSWGWIASIVIVIGSTLWLGLFAHKHVEYTNSLWWSFSFDGSAPRFLRASLASISLLFVFGIVQALRPAKPPGDLANSDELDLAATLASQSPRAAANLALLGDKRLLWGADNASFIMYGIEGRSWISMGDPVGPKDKLDDLVWSFRNLCDRYEAMPVFYQVEAELLPLYLDHGLTVFKIGEEARVPLANFSLAGSARKSLRQTQNRFKKLNCSFEIIDRQQVTQRINELQQVSDAWLLEKDAAEKGFSLGTFQPEYIKRFPAALIRQEGRIVAFANLWAGENREELSIDLMRYVKEAPAGVMEHLFVELMLWGREQGYQNFSLGMAPLSGLENRPLAPLWNRVGGLMFRHGEHFYNFEGLRNYKDKFDPEWRPKYIAAPGGFHIARVLRDIATLISGGVRGLISK